MNTKFVVIATALVAVSSVCSFSPAIAAEKEEKTGKSEKSGLSSADKKFAEKAAKGGMMEVAWGKEAADRGQNNDVKKFGNRMVTDHSKANDELKSIASKKGITLPSEEPQPKFSTDRAYMDMMVKDHEKDLAEFQDEAKNGKDPDLKKFANDASKVVADHLSMARKIDKDLKQNTSSLAR